MLKIIVAGSRSLNSVDDRNRVYKILDRLRTEIGDFEVISGMCPKGADQFAYEWGNERNLKVHEFPAKWRDENGKHNPKAGFIRNEEMAKVGNILIVFWDKESNGTQNMINNARKYGLDVTIF